MRKHLAAGFVALAAASFTHSAGAAELRLYGGGHFQGSGKAVAEAFAKKTGTAASYTPGNTGGGAFARKLKAGEQMDVIVMTSDDMANQVKAGLIRGDSVANFARDGMGIAVLKGAPKPDVSTPEKLRAALLAARAVGMQDPDPAHHSGVIVHQILEKLGVVDAVAKKTVIITDASSALEAGKVDFSIWSLPELMAQARAKVDVAGPVPSAVNGYTDESVGILTSAQNPKEAEEFVRFITSADGRAAWTKTGLEPMPKSGD
ncbi:MAG: substrate-binding domain-containing protein [Alphaproteobacteria bacterium]|nr:substrate-binding domain-containing protein [Alphaproteobacteria bacterium]